MNITMLRAHFTEGPVIQERMVAGRQWLLTYGTRRMMELGEELEDDSCLGLPDELLAVPNRWVDLLHLGDHHGIFWPHMEIGMMMRRGQGIVCPFTLEEGDRLPDITMITPIQYYRLEFYELIFTFRQVVQARGAVVSRRFFWDSTHTRLTNLQLDHFLELMRGLMGLRIPIFFFLTPRSGEARFVQ